MENYVEQLEIQVTQPTFLLGMIFSIMVADALFFMRLRRRKNFVVRVVLSVVLYMCSYVFLSPLVIKIDNAATWWLQFLLSVAAGLICFEHRLNDILFCVICALAVQNTNNIMVEIITYIAGYQGLPNYAYVPVYIVSAVVIYGLAYLLIIRRIKKDDNIIARNNWFVIVAAIVLLFGATGYLNYLPYDTVVHNWLTRLFRILINLIVIILLLSFRINKNLLDEQKALEMVIQKGSEQFNSMREYMDIIDIKCHDLKKALNACEFEEGVNREITSELAQAVEEYRNTPKTGIAVLDVILYDKIIICKQNDITLTYMVNGSALSGLKSVDIATIFNNLLYNAMEYMQTLEDKDKRLISMDIDSKNGFLYICVENYCEADINFSDGLPKTTKGANHGLGLKSVRYTVEKYKGAFAVRHEDNLFSVDIVIPL